MNRKATPAEAKPLVNDAGEEFMYGVFSYSSFVGILLYLSGISHPEFSLAVGCSTYYVLSKAVPLTGT